MLPSEITYSFPLGAEYQDADGNKVQIIALPKDTLSSANPSMRGKFVGIVNGDLFPFDADELEPYVDKPDKLIEMRVSELKDLMLEVAGETDNFESFLNQVLSKLENS